MASGGGLDRPQPGSGVSADNESEPFREPMEPAATEEEWRRTIDSF